MALELAPPSRPSNSQIEEEQTKEDMLIAQLEKINCINLDQSYHIYYKKSSVNKNTDKYNFDSLSIRPC